MQTKLNEEEKALLKEYVSANKNTPDTLEDYTKIIRLDVEKHMLEKAIVDMKNKIGKAK